MLIRSTLSLSLCLSLSLATLATAQTIVAPSDVCVGDADGDTEVTVDEILQSVNNALDGCAFEPVTLNFAAVVGDLPFQCGTAYEGIGLSDATFVPSDFRFYLSNIRLIDLEGREVPVTLEQDGVWQLEDLVLLDFENKQPPCNIGTTQTNTTVRGMVPVGDYNGIRFTLGVPFRMNHQNAATAPSPLVITAMFWNWQGGYKFIRIDEATDMARIHLGSTGCTGPSPNDTTSCQRPNRGEVFLPNFDPASDTIVADLAALLQDSDVAVNQPETPPGCMSGPTDSDCAAMMQNMGVNFANGLPDPSRQKFFRVGGTEPQN